MKKSFILLTLSLLSVFSCTTDNDIKHEEHTSKEISNNLNTVIEETKETFTSEFINLPKNSRFETPL